LLPLRTLFLEDSPADQELAEMRLRKGGLNINPLRVETRDEFLRALEAFHPDIIIADYSMPGFDGMQALILVKELHPEIPFILLTDSLIEATAVKCMKVGASDYVIKENIDRLPFAVLEAIKQQQTQNEKERTVDRLRKSEAALRQAQRVSHVGSWEWHIPSNHLEWSDEMYTIFGIQKKAFSGDLSEGIRRAIHPADFAKVEKSNQLVIAEGKPTPLKERICGMNDIVNDSITSMRRIATELRPSLLDDLGLNAALEWQAQEFSRCREIPHKLILPKNDLSLNPTLTTSLFRIYQETLTNISRRAQASLVKISLELKDQAVILIIRDNGIGITEKNLKDPHALGLLSLQERAAQWNGNVTIRGKEGKGATVTVRIPLPVASKNKGPK